METNIKETVNYEKKKNWSYIVITVLYIVISPFNSKTSLKTKSKKKYLKFELFFLQKKQDPEKTSALCSAI